MSSVARAPPGVVNLAVGHPSPQLLPTAVLSAACQAAGAALLAPQPTPAFNLNYGENGGEKEVRAVLAAYIGRTMGAAPTPESLFVSAGVSHGLDACCAALTQPGDVCLVARPTYFLAARVLRDHRLRLHDVPSCAAQGGLDLDALEAELQAGLRPRLAYVITTHANPTGLTLSVAARQRLVSLAQRYGFFVLADEVYTLLSWGEQLPPRMRSFDTGECEALAVADGRPSPAQGSTVLALNSFSKSLAPALRCGWVEAAPPLVRLLGSRGMLVSGGCLAPFVSRLLCHALLPGGGAEAHAIELAASLRARCEMLQASLDAEAAAGGVDWVCETRPQGGYFIWMRLPQDVDCDRLVVDARERFGVSVLAGRACWQGDDAVTEPPRHVRVCFSFLSPDEMVEGVRRLAAAVRAARTI